MLGLTHDLLAADDRYWQLIGHARRLPFQEAARRALAEERGRGQMRGLEQLLEAAVARYRPARNTSGNSAAP